jgi:hypothetical protein
MKIYVDGLERSGNTFLSGAIGYTLGVEVIPLWSHKIETLENRDKESPFIVPLRDALPSLVSGKIYKDYAIEHGLNKHNTGLYADTEVVLQRYKDYTQYLLDNEDLFVAPFHEFTKNHNSVINAIAKEYDLEIVKRFYDKEIIDLIGEKPELANPQLSNFPRESAPEKATVEEMFLSNYKEDIDAIQANIDKLYKRYYEKEKA